MDLQLANRLQRHRKAHGYSQEALAAALGISRQAVSKWECGEASPDTENLIRLAKLYHISLDELILSDEARSDALAPAERSETSPNVGTPSKTEDETFHGGEKKRESEGEASDNRNDAEDAPKELAEFIKKHRENGDEIETRREGDTFTVNATASRVQRLWAGIDAAVFFLCLVAFLLLGFLGNFWHPAWLLFLLVPIVASLGEAVKKRNASAFAFPVLVTAVYLFLGCVWEFWHPAWIIFLSVPLYYTIAELFHKK